MRRTGLALALALTAGACGGDDSESPLDAAATDAATTDAVPLDAPPDAAVDAAPYNGPAFGGTFLLAVHASFETQNDPAFYVQFLVTWDVDANAHTVDGSALPLCTVEACATPRSALPPPFVTTDIAIGNPPGFDHGLLGILPGQANPFTGSDQSIQIILHAQSVSADRVCGIVSGTVAGIDVAGSTFAAQRVTDTAPASLPAPLAACP